MAVEPDGERFRVTCAGGCERPLDWTVDTREHADNLDRKHIREHHPEAPAGSTDPSRFGPSTLPVAFDIGAAARCALALEDESALLVWAALTNSSPDDAQEIALLLAGHDTTLTVPGGQHG